VNAVDSMATTPLIAACRNGCQDDKVFRTIVEVSLSIFRLPNCNVTLNTPWASSPQELIGAGASTNHQNYLGSHPSLLGLLKRISVSRARVLGRRDSPESRGHLVGVNRSTVVEAEGDHPFQHELMEWDCRKGNHHDTYLRVKPMDASQAPSMAFYY
jgi:hypothetical protein